MEKIPFKITAEQKDKTAFIRITGVIGWETDAETFRQEVDKLKAGGATSVHLYLNGPGGSCFDAAEIVNILLSAFPGGLTGEGGALVASAYTYIAAHCGRFEMPKNGHFMVHKPSGGVCGTATEILNYHKLLSDKEAEYYDKYKERATNTAELNTRWNAGDWWLTAEEAKNAGFITDVRQPVAIDRSTAQAIVACGCPEKVDLLINTKNDKMKELKELAASLGLPESATEADIQAKISENAQAVADLTALKKEVEEKRQAELAKKVKETLDQAQADHRINAEIRPAWEKKLLEDFEGAGVMLAAVAPAQDLSKWINAQSSAATFAGKTWEQLQEENPEALAELERTDPAAFRKLFDNWKQRKGI